MLIKLYVKKNRVKKDKMLLVSWVRSMEGLFGNWFVEDFLTNYIILSIIAKIHCNRKIELIMEFFLEPKIACICESLLHQCCFSGGLKEDKSREEMKLPVYLARQQSTHNGVERLTLIALGQKL